MRKISGLSFEQKSNKRLIIIQRFVNRKVKRPVYTGLCQPKLTALPSGAFFGNQTFRQ